MKMGSSWVLSLLPRELKPEARVKDHPGNLTVNTGCTGNVPWRLNPRGDFLTHVNCRPLTPWSSIRLWTVMLSALLVAQVP